MGMQIDEGVDVSTVHGAIGSARASLETLLQRILASSQLSMKAIHKMALVEKEMRRIAKILDDVDRIAQDSRILSVNARIEAVRVGELGRGFAVVASEINQLARHSETTSTSIRGVLDAVEANVVSAFDELKQMAADDMSEALLRKSDVDRTLDLLSLMLGPVKSEAAIS